MSAMVLNGRRSGLVSPVRNNFFYGKMMDEAHFEIEQAYGVGIQRLVDRLALGAGVLCGLSVTAREGDLVVSSGVAVDPQGRVIVVPVERCVEAQALQVEEGKGWEYDACGGGRRRWLTLCVRYHECLDEPVAALVSDCDTRLGCEPSVIRERFQLVLLPGLPPPPGAIPAGACALVFPPAAPHGFDRRAKTTSALAMPCAAPDETCVVLAAVGLPNEADDALLVDDLGYRTALHSNSELFDLLLCLAARMDRCEGGHAAGAPAIAAMWPMPGAVLPREGAESDWSGWRREPRIELTFDRPMDADGLAREEGWLRAWAVVPGEAGQARYLRLRLEYDERSSSGAGCGRERAVYQIDDPLNIVRRSLGSAPLRVLVQVRAEHPDEGLLDASPTPALLGAEHAGTAHTPSELDDIWRSDDIRLATGLGPFVGTGAALPSGDGFAGGRLHAWFGIDPVDRAGPPVVTGHVPRNAARVRGAVAPEIEISFDRPVDDGKPYTTEIHAWLRAWWFERRAGQVIHRRLDLTYAGPRDPAAILADYESEIDPTVGDEIAFTMAFTLAEPPDVGASGRCLVQIDPANGPVDDAGARMAACFAGSRLAFADLLEIWDLPSAGGALSPQDGWDQHVWEHLVPTDARLPRAAARPGRFHLVFSRERSR